ncbi:MAG: endonuclease [Ignavibacteriales bacterium]|nr:endonuclease [Ignavibacteriales bacterium]
MKNYFSFSFLSLVSVIDTFGQLSSVTQELTFPLTVLKNNVNGTFYLVNHFDSPKTVKVVSLLSVFTPVDTLVTIPANDSAQITVVYRPTQNVTDKSFLAFYTTDSSASFAVVLNGSGSTGDTYQTVTFDKYDAALKTALNGFVINQIVLGYNTARDRMFENIDKQPGDTIECVYTGRKIKAATRLIAQNQGFNTEHTWPQSMFGSDDPMVCDINHLFPTDEIPNGQRGNYPFGVVTSGITWTGGGSKLGNGIGGKVFEPRDVHKGNVARSMLYFVIRYPNNYGSFLNVSRESVFRIWNVSDPIDARELARNNGVATYQMRRNPLIDHPEFVDRVYSFINNNSASPDV